MNHAHLTDATRHSRIAHLLRTSCPYCHALAGEPCRSRSGTPLWDIAQMHSARLMPARYSKPSSSSTADSART
jgi:cytochrome c2